MQKAERQGLMKGKGKGGQWGKWNLETAIPDWMNRWFVFGEKRAPLKPLR